MYVLHQSLHVRTKYTYTNTSPLLQHVDHYAYTVDSLSRLASFYSTYALHIYTHSLIGWLSAIYPGDNGLGQYLVLWP